ncbi:type II toxin-antitoxin system Phd/YefM family antitoxin [Rhodococcus zopfii]|uniref:type II toxin-antitoxin system Phd/YefM family antitoxin n=1 Tax=Rhodococcus zopfii TaxID=43772 RepID=UPI000A949236|nr:prevent-host-death family protein [Rhodococcus zopfii]
MPATTVKSARKNLKSLVREVNGDTVAVEIVGEQDNAVLISLARYTALREATFLLRSPELMDSLRREAARSLPPIAAGEDPAATDAAATAEPPVTPPAEPKSRGRKKRKKNKKRSRRR